MKELQQLIDWAKDELKNAKDDASGYEDCQNEKIQYYHRGRVAAFFKTITEAELLLLREKSNSDAQPQLPQASVSGWRAFQAGQMPEPGQEIWIVWPDDSPPEIRKLTEDDLKGDWSGMRWMPVPAYR